MVRFAFQMSQTEREKFCGGNEDQQIQKMVFHLYLFFVAKFDLPSIPHSEDEQTQEDRSAMFTIWNIIADLAETQDQYENDQQEIVDFYAKAGSTLPRIVCLMQLYFYACEIFERVNHLIVFSEGDNHDLIINDNFVTAVENIIKKDYHKYDTSYLTSTEINQAGNPMVIVEKETVISA
jgi:hypothetical protein